MAGAKAVECLLHAFTDANALTSSSLFLNPIPYQACLVQRGVMTGIFHF